MAHTVMAYVLTAYTVMAYMAMTYIVMALAKGALHQEGGLTMSIDRHIDIDVCTATCIDM